MIQEFAALLFRNLWPISEHMWNSYILFRFNHMFISCGQYKSSPECSPFYKESVVILPLFLTNK